MIMTVRLVTLSLGGEGYLTFMGNEFGHPEWIDFPREGNGWSYHYCRRQWSLADNPNLRYQFLNRFEKDMVALSKKHRVMGGKEMQLWLDNPAKILVYKKGGAIFAFNFHPTESKEGFEVVVPEKGDYQVILSTDDHCYGGHCRVNHQTYSAQKRADGKYIIKMYLPSRTATVLKKV